MVRADGQSKEGVDGGVDEELSTGFALDETVVDKAADFWGRREFAAFLGCVGKEEGFWVFCGWGDDDGGLLDGWGEGGNDGGFVDADRT